MAARRKTNLGEKSPLGTREKGPGSDLAATGEKRRREPINPRQCTPKQNWRQKSPKELGGHEKKAENGKPNETTTTPVRLVSFSTGGTGGSKEGSQTTRKKKTGPAPG